MRFVTFINNKNNVSYMIHKKFSKPLQIHP